MPESILNNLFTAAEKEKNVRIIEEEVSIKSKLCQEDLLKAEPIMRAAIAALDTLDKNNLTELKSFGSPAQAVVDVASAVLVLMTKGKIPKDRSWKACKVMMGNVGQFLDNLKNYDKKNISPDVIKALMPYLEVCKNWYIDVIYSLIYHVSVYFRTPILVPKSFAENLERQPASASG